ncbi:MAG: RNA 2',3'-cyclic phosphodiesterase [Victivallales bacterium]|jgi:2'-5' RNA ligase
MPRLFIAIDIPDRVKDNICELRRNLPGVRWTVRDQIHITMRFIGDADDLFFKQIKASLSEIKLPPFSLEIAGSGFFPNERRPSVFWLGCGESRALSDLKDYMDLALDSCGIPPESRKFHPHLTVARLKMPSEKDCQKLSNIYSDMHSASFNITEFILYSSILKSDCAEHFKECVYPLQPAAPET